MEKILLKNSEVFDVIVNCYQSDNELVSKFHVTPGNLSGCVDRTVSDLLNNNVNVYKIQENDRFIGYFGESEGQYLNGFFVMPKERPVYTASVWNLIKDHFGNPFNTAIFAKNDRAVKFLKKNDCKIIEVVNTDDGVGFIFECEVKKCH